MNNPFLQLAPHEEGTIERIASNNHVSGSFTDIQITAISNNCYKPKRLTAFRGWYSWFLKERKRTGYRVILRQEFPQFVSM